MLLAGDELGRTQGGNNNAYCQDNDLGWLDRSHMSDESGGLFLFVRRLIALRRTHPVLRRPRFFRGVTTSESPVKDITWYAPDAREMTFDDWHDPSLRSFAALLSGETGDRFISLEGYRELDDSFLLIVNAHDASVAFTLPPAPSGGRWMTLIDTARWNDPANDGASLPGERYDVVDRSLALLIAAR